MLSCPFHVLSLIASSNSLCIAGTSHTVGWDYGAGQDLAAQSWVGDAIAEGYRGIQMHLLPTHALQCWDTGGCMGHKGRTEKAVYRGSALPKKG